MTKLSAWSQDGPSNTNGRYEGAIEIRTTHFHPRGNPDDSADYRKFVQKKWFRDQYVIAEMSILHVDIDTARVTRMEQRFNCYLYKNFKTGNIFQFMHLSDTAMPVRTFKITDTANLPGGGYYARGTSKNIRHSIKSYFLADTVIENVTLKRNVQLIPFGKEILFDVFYLRCDLDRSMLNVFHLHDSLNNISNCIVVKGMRMLSLDSKIPIQTSELKILANQLTPEQSNIFDAWEKSANEYLLLHPKKRKKTISRKS